MSKIVYSSNRFLLNNVRRALKRKERSLLSTMADVHEKHLDDPGGLKKAEKFKTVAPNLALPSGPPNKPVSPNTEAVHSHYKPVTVKSVSVPLVLYRRPLPQSCISFSSDEGKEIFKEALLSGHMDCYFRLAAQFRTQNEPAYCGLATLVMVLNALEIDPGRVWKGPWKWYHEDMLDCCVPTQLVRQQGVTFDEFICLADCNYLDTRAARVDASSKEEDFRTLVKEITKKENTFLISSYSRPVLGQTGDGHFAPVSGYHPGRDLVLILDTARFKYPPHWIPLSLLFESMKAIDVSTGLSRGYIQVWAAQNSKSLLLFKIAEQLSINTDPQVAENCQRFLAAWANLLSSPVENSPGGDVSVVKQTLQGLVGMAREHSLNRHLLSTQEHVSCTNACSVKCVVRDLLAELERTWLFRSVSDEVESLSADDVNTLENIFGSWESNGESENTDGSETKEGTKEKDDVKSKSSCCDLTKGLNLSHFVTAFLFSWPYSGSPSPGSLAALLQSLSQNDQSQLEGNFLLEEICTLNRQLRRLTGFHSSTEECEMPQQKTCCSKSNKGQSKCAKSENAQSEKPCCSKKKEL